MKDPLYRLRQFLSAANATPLTGEQVERVRSVLNETQLALYQTMPLGDQRHGLNIFDALVAQGDDEHPLLQAALLHDVAKRQVGLGYRTGVILLNKLSDTALRRVASDNPHSWRYPFYLSLHHPALGAELATRVGLEENVVTLIRAHQDKVQNFTGRDAAQLCEWHRALKKLDDAN